MKNVRKTLIMLSFVFVLSMVYRGDAQAAAMGSFPTQSENSYSKSYTRGMQVMLLHYNSKICNKVLQGGGADGIFGGKTTEAVKLFQQSKGLSADGICGRLTWNNLATTLRAERSSNGYTYFSPGYQHNQSDYYTSSMRKRNSDGYWSCYYKNWYPVG